MSFNTIHEKKILAKNSEFTVIEPMHKNLVFIANKVRKMSKIRNRYNQAQHLTQDTNGKVTTSQLDNINESQEVSTFPAGDHKAPTNRRA